MRQARDILLYLSLKYEGDWDKTYDAILRRDSSLETDFDERVSSFQGKYITLLDDEYPSWLKTIYHPPFVLFYRGDISLISSFEKMISVVGSRNYSTYGKEMTEKIVAGLAKDYIIVSGMAKGIDSVAHNASINNGGKTVAILGTGIDICYPAENKELYKELCKNHLVISEYPGHSSTNIGAFPSRNRIIAGLSRATIVAEAYARSGTLITVGLALEYGRDVMCVPYLGNANSQCNRIINEGAILVENAQDVIDGLTANK